NDAEAVTGDHDAVTRGWPIARAGGEFFLDRGVIWRLRLMLSVAVAPLLGHRGWSSLLVRRRRQHRLLRLRPLNSRDAPRSAAQIAGRNPVTSWGVFERAGLLLARAQIAEQADHREQPDDAPDRHRAHG